ncbi:MAG: sulfur carrier protein ThiS, partial [Planctomycetota bacterium]
PSGQRTASSRIDPRSSYAKRMITLTVNGKQATFEGEQLTVAALIDQQGLGDQPVAVEVNCELVPKRDHAEKTLAAGDTVELVTLVGGG